MGENETELVRYRLAANESRFTVQVFSEGLLSAFGHDPVIDIRDFEGEVSFTPGTFSQAQLRMTVRADSLAASQDVKEKDRLELERLMYGEVLETEKYPEIVLTSSNVSVKRLREGRYRVRVAGNLQLHGVTQPNLWIYAEVSFEGERLRAQGDFTLNQTDFNIKPVKVAGGAIRIKNELKFFFDISARKS